MQDRIALSLALACCLISGSLNGLLSSRGMLIQYACQESGEQGTAIAGDQSCYTKDCGSASDACGPCENDGCCEIQTLPQQPAEHATHASARLAATQALDVPPPAAGPEAAPRPSTAPHPAATPPPGRTAFAGFQRPLRA